MNIFPVLTPSAVRMFSVVATSKNDIMHTEPVGDEERGLAALKLMSDLLTGLWATKLAAVPRPVYFLYPETTQCQPSRAQNSQERIST